MECDSATSEESEEVEIDDFYKDSPLSTGNKSLKVNKGGVV